MTDGGDATGEGHARQSTAPLERHVADGSDTAGEGHTRQSTAITERTFADGGDAAGEGHARQTKAITERRVADGGDREVIDTVWDDQGAGGLWVGACDGDAVSIGDV